MTAELANPYAAPATEVAVSSDVNEVAFAGCIGGEDFVAAQSTRALWLLVAAFGCIVIAPGIYFAWTTSDSVAWTVIVAILIITMFPLLSVLGNSRWADSQFSHLAGQMDGCADRHGLQWTLTQPGKYSQCATEWHAVHNVSFLDSHARLFLDRGRSMIVIPRRFFPTPEAWEVFKQLSQAAGRDQP